MSPAIFLRVASVLAAIQGTAHGALFLTSKPRNGPAEIALVESMKSQYFNFAGGQRSYWGFYLGYGLLAAFYCLVEAVLFWQLARLADMNPSSVRPMVWLFVLVNVVHALLMARYFFWVPIAFDILVGAALCAALLARGPAGTPLH